MVIWVGREELAPFVAITWEEYSSRVLIRQSNHVIRHDHQSHDPSLARRFVRVEFRDEDRLAYRWDGGAQQRVGDILRHGFVSPFYDPVEGYVTSDKIRSFLGEALADAQQISQLQGRIRRGPQTSIKMRFHNSKCKFPVHNVDEAESEMARSFDYPNPVHLDSDGVGRPWCRQGDINKALRKSQGIHLPFQRLVGVVKFKARIPIPKNYRLNLRRATLCKRQHPVHVQEKENEPPKYLKGTCVIQYPEAQSFTPVTCSAYTPCWCVSTSLMYAFVDESAFPLGCLGGGDLDDGLIPQVQTAPMGENESMPWERDKDRRGATVDSDVAGLPADWHIVIADQSKVGPCLSMSYCTASSPIDRDGKFDDRAGA
ncbi:hypothetical protein V8E52_005721 [Russula decolorans]